MKTNLIIDSSTIVSRDKLPSFVEVLPLVVIVNEEIILLEVHWLKK